MPSPNVSNTPRLPWAAWLLLIFINGLVLTNAILHDPFVSYDGLSHRHYARTLATGRLPTPAETKEYFSPPLAYLPAAALYHLGVTPETTGKCWQYLNVLFSVALTWGVARAFCLIAPDAARLAWLPLLLLGMFPVYYRTFAMPRSEPLLATLAVLALWQMLRMLRKPALPIRDCLLMGLLCGLLVLTRQWGFFLLPGLFIPLLLRLWFLRERWKSELRSLAVVFGVFLLIGAPFYIHLKASYGSITAFNRNQKKFSLKRLRGQMINPATARAMFQDPVRPSLQGKFLPIFYSETWGDYWGYFLITGYDLTQQKTRNGSELSDRLASPALTGKILTNRLTMGRHLGQINVVALLPTAAFLLALLLSIKIVAQNGFAKNWGLAEPRNPTLPLLALLLMIGVTVTGYVWFDVKYHTLEGDTIKAAYLLQVFPLVSLLAASMAARLWPSHPRVFVSLVVVTGVVVAVFSPSFVTRCHPLSHSTLTAIPSL